MTAGEAEAIAVQPGALQALVDVVNELKEEFQKLREEFKRQNDLSAAWLLVATKVSDGLLAAGGSNPVRYFVYVAGVGALLRIWNLDLREAVTLLEAVPL